MSTNHPPSPRPTTLLVGISGPSSSGKTTLSRLLRELFTLPSPSSSNSLNASQTPSSTTHPTGLSLSPFIVHLDDFYHTDTLIPLITTPSTSPSGLGSRTLQDWDCVESLDLPLLTSTIEEVRQTGNLPVGSVSKEDQNSVGAVPLREGVVEEVRGVVGAWWEGIVQQILKSTADTDNTDNTGNTGSEPSERTPKHGSRREEVRLCILDGFLLYPDPHNSTDPGMVALREGVAEKLDLRLFLPVAREKMLERRGRRTGYVTLEGFWEDPEGYVEDVVWVNYVRDCGWMFEAEEMGVLRKGVVEEAGVRIASGDGKDGMEGLFRWGVREVMGLVEGRIGGRREGMEGQR